MRRILAALALVAVSVALAQSLCDWHPQDAAQYEGCCVSLADGAIAAAAGALLPVSGAQAVLPPQTVTLAPRPPAQLRVIDLPRERPPLSRPFHARSARILT